MDEVVKLIKAAKLFFLATENDGQPDVRPMGSVFPVNGKLYFVLAKPMNLFKELMDNDKIAISAYDGKNILRLSATAVSDDNADVIEELYKAAPPLKNLFPESVIAPFYLKNATAKIGEFGKEPVSCNF